jgi:hypothetical protein
MAKPIKYKRPRKINVWSVSLAIALAVIVFLTYQYLPHFLTRQEIFRILDETSSKYTASSGRYFAVKEEVKRLQVEMANTMRRSGVTDPSAEFWIEPDSENSVRFGVLYSEFTEWPFELIPKQEKVVELEMECTRVTAGRSWTCGATTADAGQR